jgi:bud site selection protein 31
MPAIRSHTARGKKPPAGFDDIRDDLEVFGIKMKDAQNTPTNNVPKHQAQWPIFQIAHQRSRYIYELYYEKEAISKELYDWLLKNSYADPMLIAKWKKQGYEKVSYVGFESDQSHGFLHIYFGYIFEKRANVLKFNSYAA